MLDLFKGVLEGLETLHSHGYMHRDITIRNMLVMSDNPPQAVLCDFGKTILGQTCTSKSAGPVTTRAPEMDGVQPYSNAVDIWSCGYAFARVLVPDMTSTTGHNPDDRQDEDWIEIIIERLLEVGEKSMLHEQVTDLVMEMLEFLPENRPTVVEILERWPVKSPVPSASLSDDEGPPEKFQKSSETTKVARGAPVPSTYAAVVNERLTGVEILDELKEANRDA